MNRLSRTLVVFDSLYGNTEKIAKRVGDVLDAKVVPVVKLDQADLEELDLLIVGSPVHGGRPTQAIELFINTLRSGSLKGVQVAGFDTRFAVEDHGLGLKILMNIIRFAAERIVLELTKKGGTQVGKPMGFIVKDKEGPLEEGEMERAVVWAKELGELVK